MNIDTHMHSLFSCDGKASLEEMCLSAIRKGLAIICFTEHFDMNPKDDGLGFFKYDEYSDAIKRAQDKYSSEITILKGLEFSEPHLYKRELERFNSLDFDFILGSVHWIGENWIGDKEYVRANSLDKIYEAHYRETLKASKAGLFDSLAHIDFPKRYLAGKREPLSLIEETMKNLVANDISLEVNSSPLRKGYDEPYPSNSILESYLACGGKHVTIGSDAHTTNDVGADLGKIGLDERLVPCYYQKRKRKDFSL